MDFTVREMRDQDAGAFLEVHHAAVRGLAAKDYSSEIIELWATLPISRDSIERVIANPDDEVRFVAECENKIVGISCLVTANNELRACYVAPEYARLGIGRALISEVEAAAREFGLSCLQADSSLTAEPFYRSLGYRVRKRGVHWLRKGVPMPCVKMEKLLTAI